MADTKLSDLTELSAAPANGDLVPIVDVSDTSMAATGTNKKITAQNLRSGLATTSHTHATTDITGLTSSAAELNILDGALLSTTELNYVDGVTSAIQTQIDNKVTKNANITGATKTKITYDAKGLVTAGADATTTDISEGTNLYYTNTRADARIAAASVNDLADVTISAPSTGQVLKYNGSAWINDTDATAGGGGGGDASTNTATSVDSEVALFSGTGGKTLKRATGSGIAKLTSGVLSTATAGTDYSTPSSTDTLTNKTFDANGTGNSISNIEVADLASGVLDTDLSSVAGTDTTIPSAKATKAMGDLKLAIASNLSDLNNAGTARTNLGLGTIAVLAAPSGTVVGTSDTQTLTNKRITKRHVALTDGATITVDVDVTDIGSVTLGGNRTIAFSGTPTEGQMLQLRFKQDGTGSRTITWPASVSFGTDITATTLTTTAAKTDYVGLQYNSVETKWHVLAFVKGY